MNPLLLSQPADIRPLSMSEKDALVVSAVQIDGDWKVVSRYGDTSWTLIGGTTNDPASNRRLNFGRVPEPFRPQLKEITYRYMRRGRALGKRPGVRTLRTFLVYAISFIRYLDEIGIKQLTKATPLACAGFVHARRNHTGREGRSPTAGHLSRQFGSIEAIYELSQYTDDPMPSFPWPGDSAWNLAGLGGKQKSDVLRAGKTPLIPDDTFCTLFQAAWDVVLQAERILDVRDELNSIQDKASEQSRVTTTMEMNRHLVGTEFKNVRSFNHLVMDIRTACYIVVASLSGCRNHEMAYLQSNACYTTEDDDGEVYWWMKSRSDKTEVGHTEWMIPEAAATALKIMDRWAKPYQEELLAEIRWRRDCDPSDIEITEAEKHVNAVFVGKDPKEGPRSGHQVRTLSINSWNPALRAFAKKHEIYWNVTSHQFRRTFANYAARSQFGDLRYLKEHFKHWSFDMTLGYAMNEYQELALYAEVYDALDDLREGVVGDWMEADVPLAGGLGERVAAWRGSHDVTLFKDHKSMVKTLAEGFTSLRSNGHAWCTADQGIDCIGNGGLDRTRCADCEHAVIGRVHVSIYKGIYSHLKTTLDCQDIGDAGLAYVRRSITRCADVLRSLGHDPDAEATA